MTWLLSSYSALTNAEIQNIAGPVGWTCSCSATYCTPTTLGAGLLQRVVFKVWFTDPNERFVCRQKHSSLPLRGSAKGRLTLPVQHLQISNSVCCLRRCRGLQNPARPMVHTHQASRPQNRLQCPSDPHLSAKNLDSCKRVVECLPKAKMRTKSPSLSSHSLPASLHNSTKTVFLGVNKTCLGTFGQWNCRIQLNL